eukprot:scaffold631_cov338-Pinguiococcus_pyrenoidosus.AAC.4
MSPGDSVAGTTYFAVPSPPKNLVSPRKYLFATLSGLSASTPTITTDPTGSGHGVSVGLDVELDVGLGVAIVGLVLATAVGLGVGFPVGLELAVAVGLGVGAAVGERVGAPPATTKSVGNNGPRSRKEFEDTHVESTTFMLARSLGSAEADDEVTAAGATQPPAQVAP